jgi:hypothetical protein
LLRTVPIGVMLNIGISFVSRPSLLDGSNGSLTPELTGAPRMLSTYAEGSIMKAFYRRVR